LRGHAIAVAGELAVRQDPGGFGHSKALRGQR
jgi:hypothetical protein